jgi:hypothetical protein
MGMLSRRKLVMGLALAASVASLPRWFSKKPTARKVRLLAHDGTLMEVDRRHVRVKGVAGMGKVQSWIWSHTEET